MVWGDRSGHPKFPKSADGTVPEAAEKRWFEHLTRFIAIQDVGEHLAQPAESLPYAIHTLDHRQLYERFTEDVVTAHLKLLQNLCTALDGSTLENDNSSCTLVPSAWNVIQRW